MTELRHIAVVGGGIAGLSAAWLLSHRYNVSLYEANDYVGGHSNTVECATRQGNVAVDTGFVVFNSRNYPNLVNLFRWLDVKSQAADMSFSVSMNDGAYEYAGTSAATLFAQRENLASRSHWALLAEIVRFNRLARRALQEESLRDLTLGEFLSQRGFSATFESHYLLPMGAAIWSCPVAAMRRFPAQSFLSFFLNHGLLDLTNRPQWRTVTGGSQSYVEKMLRRLRGRVLLNSPVDAVQRVANGVQIVSRGESRRFDAVVFGCHADQALRAIESPYGNESNVLGAFEYQPNDTFLHTDTALMPTRRAVWSSWNYIGTNESSDQRVFVSYWMNCLQRLRSDVPLIVSLNPTREPREDRVIERYLYEHPVFNEAALNAQARLHEIQGQDRLWFCGSYFGHGFHEDALTSAIEVGRQLGVQTPWERGARVSAAALERAVAW